MDSLAILPDFLRGFHIDSIYFSLKICGSHRTYGTQANYSPVISFLNLAVMAFLTIFDKVELKKCD